MSETAEMGASVVEAGVEAVAWWEAAAVTAAMAS
jgi:hypothetical protein